MFSFSVFTWSIYWNSISNGQTVFLVLCSNVVWNPFLMKTTFYLRFLMVWVRFCQHLGASPLYQYSYLQDFFCTATCLNPSLPSLLFSGHLIRWFFFLDWKWGHLLDHDKQLQESQVEKWATIQEQRGKCPETCFA